MNILLINHYAGSIKHGMAYRPYYLAQEWIKGGHTVTVVAASYSHLRTQNIKLSERTVEENIDGINYVWYRTPEYSGNGIGRIRNMLTFTSALAIDSKRLADRFKPNAVIASSTYPLDNIPARHIAKHRRAKYIYEVHDLWPLSPMELGNIPSWHPYIMVMQWAEDYAYRHSNYVASLLPAAQDHMIDHGLKPGKFSYLPNGINLDEWENSALTLSNEFSQVIAEQKGKGHFMVGYVGTHGISNALDTLIEAAAELKGKPVTIMFVGKGPDRESLINKADRLSCNNVIFMPPVPKNTVPVLLDHMDALYIGAQKSPLYRFGVSPNKLMDYMMAAKPVVYAIEAGNDPVKEAACGISVPAENPKAVADAISTLMEMSPSELQTMGQRGREYVVKNHDYKVIAKRFLDILEK